MDDFTKDLLERDLERRRVESQEEKKNVMIVLFIICVLVSVFYVIPMFFENMELVYTDVYITTCHSNSECGSVCDKEDDPISAAPSEGFSFLKEYFEFE
jgi:hypothetical protein